MGPVRAVVLVCLAAAGVSGCSAAGSGTNDAADLPEGGAHPDATGSADAGLDAEICDAVCAVVRGAGCPDPSEPADCVAACVDWSPPCAGQARRYVECEVANGSSAFMCVSDGAVLKDGYCETEGALLDKCVADNLPFSENAPSLTARKLFARRVRHAPDEGN
jgi:hypothetical protein